MDCTWKLQVFACCMVAQQLLCFRAEFFINIHTVAESLADKLIQLCQCLVRFQVVSQERIRRQYFIEILELPEKCEKVLSPFLVLKVLNRSLFGLIIPAFGEWEIFGCILFHVLLKEQFQG